MEYNPLCNELLYRSSETEYNVNYEIYLPTNRNNPKYQKLENIPDYEYTYRIAYEMLMLTKSFKMLFETKAEDRHDDWIKKATELGLDTYKIKEKYKKENTVLHLDYDAFTLKDIGATERDGILKLLTYYVNKNKIYTVNLGKDILSNPYTEDIDFEEVYYNLENYSIPCKDLGSLNHSRIIMKPLNKQLRLKELEDDFLATLAFLDLKYFDGQNINKYWNKRPLVQDVGEEGLLILIDYYQKNKKIFEKIDKSEKEDFKQVDNPNYLVLINCEKFYVPCRVKGDNGKLKNVKVPISSKIPLDEIDEVGKAIEDTFSAKIKLSEIDYIDNEASSNLTIDSIKNGLTKLINYYLNIGQIIPNEKLAQNTKIKYTHCNTKNYFKDNIIPQYQILCDLQKFYIPCKKNHQNDSEGIKLQQLNENLSLQRLENAFKKTLTISDFKTKQLKIFPIFSIPMLQFDEATILNLPININLPEDEIIAYVKKIKQDYDNQSTNLKHPLQLIGENLIKAEKPNSVKELETKNIKKNIADVFYIYDIQKAFLDKRDEILKKKDVEIAKIKSSYIDKETISELIKALDDDEKYNIKKYEDDKITEHIQKLTGFSKNKITVANTYINHYIINEKYKELITGVNSLI